AGGVKLGETRIRDNPPEQARGNEISDCHLHDGGKMFPSAVGIWIGQSPDNRITHNLIHDFYYTGISLGWTWGHARSLAENNLVYRTTHGGFHEHYGETNVVRNNIFAFARDHQLQRTRPEPHPSFSFQTNLVYFDAGVLLGGDWSGDNYAMDWNLYWDA